MCGTADPVLRGRASAGPVLNIDERSSGDRYG